MKKGVKLSLGLLAIGFGVLTISGCTKSFCSNRDLGNMMYAFDPSLTSYFGGGSDTLIASVDRNIDGVNKTLTYKVENVNKVYATWSNDINGANGGFVMQDKTGATIELTYLNAINNDAINAGITPINATTIEYYKKIDELLIVDILKQALLENDLPSDETSRATFEGFTYDLNNETQKEEFYKDIGKYSYLKYVDNDTATIWQRWTREYDSKTRAIVDESNCPSTDFIKLYKSNINSKVAAYRTCIATKSDNYGTYGYSTEGVYIREKSWAYAWSRGPLEGLLVYPIGALVDVISFGFQGVGVDTGWAALLAILFVTLIIRGLMSILTIKQTSNNAKMTELQPEIQKIQNKYPNANTNNYEKQHMAEEMNRLYKKHKINPLSAILVMIVQFPVFICVWGALSGSATLASGTIWGLDLSLGIKDVLFNGANWAVDASGAIPALTALILFLLMSGAQVVSMLLPQWLQKARAKKTAKTGVNPAQNESQNRMKIFTYVMLAMIIFMGFSLVSAMGVYWFVGALFSIAQTIITQSITSKNMKKK